MRLLSWSGPRCVAKHLKIGGVESHRPLGRISVSAQSFISLRDKPLLAREAGLGWLGWGEAQHTGNIADMGRSFPAEGRLAGVGNLFS